MTKGKPWTKEEVEKLRKLVEDKHPWKVIAVELHRSEGAVRQKCRRLGLEVVVKKSQKPRTTTSTVLPSDIVTHEQVLKVLAGTMKKAAEPGLEKVEIMRLRALIDAAKTYDSILEKFERWVEIEAQLLAMGEKITEVEKAQKKNAG